MTAWDDARLEKEQRESKRAFRDEHAQTINDAVKLLKPVNQIECEKDVIAALVVLSVQKTAWIDVTQPAREAAGVLAAALARVELAIANENLDRSLRERFPSAEIHELKSLSEKWEKLKVDQKGKGPRRKAYEKTNAIREAHFLMSKYRPDQVEKVVKDNDFCELAKLLFGRS